jgi:hypothetical protein
VTDEIKGWQINLENGRHVFVAKTDECYLVQFQREDGTKTRIKLSYEATDALRYLIGEHVPQDEIIRKFIMQWTAAAEHTEPALVWQHVKTDELPMAEPAE